MSQVGLHDHVRCMSAYPSKPGIAIGGWDVALGAKTEHGHTLETDANVASDGTGNLSRSRRTDG
jgi:hypothetical protein